MQAKKRIFTTPFYTYLKKHKCPKCGTILNIIKVKKIVDSKSNEAKNYDFQNCDTFFAGCVEITWDEFKCSQCGFQLSIKEMKQNEKNKGK